MTKLFENARDSRERLISIKFGKIYNKFNELMKNVLFKIYEYVLFLPVLELIKCC